MKFHLLKLEPVKIPGFGCSGLSCLRIDVHPEGNIRSQSSGSVLIDLRNHISELSAVSLISNGRVYKSVTYDYLSALKCGNYEFAYILSP